MAVHFHLSDQKGVCLHCGAHVTSDFERVHGDQDDRVHRCYNCDSKPRVALGSAAGLDVDHPDPKEYPGRNGGLR